jgi:hypothetical protein
MFSQARETLLKGRLSTVDLLVRTCLNQVHFYIENVIYIFNKTSYFNEEVNRTDPSPSVSIPWSGLPAPSIMLELSGTEEKYKVVLIRLGIHVFVNKARGRGGNPKFFINTL